MSTVAALYRKVKALNISKVANDSIDETKGNIADLNVEQLNKGQRSDGSSMPDYSPISVEVFGKPSGPIKLFDTGVFYAGWKVEVASGKINIFSTDKKSEMLFRRYATKKKNIFGLNPQFRREYINEFLKNKFRSKIKEATGL